ncbi:MAG: 5-formyltetrahydrofolate cyclo-ligase [Desulfurococcaceae archaeon]|jgi:5-formyltetrahydrofolate cyclo-ligase|nr:5-formyltetrahydrofolate cyclo-ligase [Desulfurococcaceae archaeon]
MVDSKSIDEIKASIRERIWRIMEDTNIAVFPRPVFGRIPNFRGADKAAERVIHLKEWARARVIKANPDSPQYYLRLKALGDEKIVIMASPRLKSGFILLNPLHIPSNKLSYAATISGAFKYGSLVKLRDIPTIDLVVTGCVAVDKRGVRLGKGGGYAELEYAILRELGVISEDTPIVTTIHDVQLVDEIPLELHDLSVDYYATPTKLVRVEPRGYKPKGVFWELLSEEHRNLEVIRELKELIKSRY